MPIPSAIPIPSSHINPVVIVLDPKLRGYPNSLGVTGTGRTTPLNLMRAIE
jgi:hypothetical protein